MEELFKVIFKMEGDSTSAIKALDEVNTKYKEQNEELKKQQINLKTLQTNEAALIKGRAASQNPTAITKYNKLLEENKKKIDDCKKSIENLTVTEQKASKATEDLSKKMNDAFDGTKLSGAANGVKKVADQVTAAEKPVQSLRAQLKDLKAQLAATDDDQEFLRLSIEAGKLTDRLDDASQAARIFATGSPFQAFGSGLRGVASDLLSLDFEGAAQKSKLLADAAGKITFKTSLEGIKQLGTTLLNTGKALLTNPIFLIGAAVALIISNFDKLTKMGGLIGNFFGGISKAITFVIDGFFKFTDAIGLTQTALERFDNFRQEQFERNTKRQLDDFDRQIKLAQALGKITDDIEKAKQRAIIRTAELELRPMQAVMDQAKTGSFIIQKEFADRYEELKKIVADAEAEIEIIEINATKRRSANAQKNREAEIERELAARRKQREFEEGGIEDLARIQEEERKKREAKEIEDKQNFEQTKLEIDLVNSAKSVDIARQEAEEKRKIEEEQARKRNELIQQELSAIQSIADATINASQQVIGTKIAEVDQLRNLQQQRVDDARKIADEGNADLLELEEKRLNDINEQRKKFVEQQQALAALELIANTAIAVSKAAAQGGAAAPITIAVALIALTAGLAQARSIASQAAFYEGGYTGDGDPKQESRALGTKPYTYHKGEFVFNHEKTGRYKDIFQDIHTGQIDLNQWRDKVQAFEAMKMMPNSGASIDVEGLHKELVMLRIAFENQSTSFNLDENGLEARFNNIKTRNDYLKKHIARA